MLLLRRVDWKIVTYILEKLDLLPSSWNSIPKDSVFTCTKWEVGFRKLLLAKLV